MAKVNFTPKPALEKLPLAVRKDLRDQFGAEKEELEAKISDLLGVPFVVEFAPNEVLAYVEDLSGSSPGKNFTSYVKGFISAVKSFVEKYGDAGQLHFNQAVPKSTLSLAVNTIGADAPTITSEVKDGIYYILFQQDRFGYNTNYVSDSILSAIEAVPRSDGGFSLQVKGSIAQYYEDDIEEVREVIAELINIPDVILDPNFEENYNTLTVDKKDDTSFHEQFGRTHIDYFRGLRKNLDSQGFKGDEMLQEGLGEVLTSKTFKIRIVKKLKGYYTEIALEDGVIYLQTTSEWWNVNPHDMGAGLVDLL